MTDTFAEHSRGEAGTPTSTSLEAMFEGLNEAESSAPMLIDIWRLTIPSADELALIGDNLGELKFQAEVLKDTTKGAGVSACWRARKVNT